MSYFTTVNVTVRKTLLCFGLVPAYCLGNPPLRVLQVSEFRCVE